MKRRFARSGQTHSMLIIPLILMSIFVIPLMTSEDANAQRRARSGATFKDPAVTLADVQFLNRNDRIAAVGSGRARRQVTISTRVSGVIEKVLFEAGQRVEAEQPLVQLSSEPEAIAVETALAQRAQAADTVARYEQLNSASVSRVARAEAETALKVADAALRRAREDLNRMTIKAPFAGTVGLTNLQIGDYLAVGTPIVTLDDRSSLIIEFTVPEAVASSIVKGLPVRANLIARSGEIYEGSVASIGTRIDPETRTLSVRAELPNPDQSLIPGSTFSISVRLPGEEAPQVPGLAVQWDRKGAYVWKLSDENTVERVDAAILARDGDRVLIDAKLIPGDKVVYEGGDSLRSGQKVRPQQT